MIFFFFFFYFFRINEYKFGIKVEKTNLLTLVKFGENLEYFLMEEINRIQCDKNTDIA